MGLVMVGVVVSVAVSVVVSVAVSVVVSVVVGVIVSVLVIRMDIMDVCVAALPACMPWRVNGKRQGGQTLRDAVWVHLLLLFATWVVLGPQVVHMLLTSKQRHAQQLHMNAISENQENRSMGSGKVWIGVYAPPMTTT
jgi:hypothetical protein